MAGLRALGGALDQTLGQISSIITAITSQGAFDYRERALASAGIDPASAEARNYAVHHVVAVTAALAQPARDTLASAGIGIHDIANLVVLPVGAHQAVHTEAYYTGVNEATFVGLSAGGSPGVNTALEIIKASLITRGQFP